MNNILVILFAIFVLIVLKIVGFIIKFKLLFKTLKKQIPYKEPDIQVKFSSTKIPQKLDYIIIGSGMGGLISGALLSKLNKKVIVLEQHTIAGGCCHTFEEKGYTFDTGLHYLGYQQAYTKFLAMAASKEIEFNPIFCYDVIKLCGQETFNMESPFEKYVSNFEKLFPDNSPQIRLWGRKLRRGFILLRLILARNALIPKYLYHLFTLILRIVFSDVYMKTTQDVLDQLNLSKNKKLSALLCAQYGDLGVTPDKCPFILQAGLSNFYMNGAVYPKHGALDLVKSIASTIEQNGNVILTKAKVTEIIVENNKIVGVMVGKNKIECPNVISTIGIPQTIQLLPEKCRWPVKYKDSISHFYCFIGLKGQNLKLPNYNLWDVCKDKDYNYIKERDEYLDTMNFDKMLTFTSFPQAKMQEITDKNSAIIIAEAKPEWVMQYRINEVQRKEGYKEFKQKLQDAFLKNFQSNFPYLTDKIDHISISTPLTNENYLGRHGSYGLEISMKRFYDDDIFGKNTTNIKGLFLAGEDTVAASVSQAIMSGFLVTLKVENYI